MSTNNFSFENILVVIPDFNLYHDCQSHIDDCAGHNCDCDNCGLSGQDKECKHKGEYIDFDQFSYDEYVGDLQSQLEKIGFEASDKRESGRDEGKIIARYGIEDTDCMIVWVEVIIRSGYYDGANIDYTIDGDFGIENEQNKKQVAHYEAMHRKLDRLVAKTKKILRANGTELLKVGQFSNGEAVYKKK